MRVYTTLLSSLSAGYPLYVYPLQREGKHFADAQITLPNYILQTFGISVQPDSQLALCLLYTIARQGFVYPEVI